MGVRHALLAHDPTQFFGGSRSQINHSSNPLSNLTNTELLKSAMVRGLAAPTALKLSTTTFEEAWRLLEGVHELPG
jgi:hypothetical protein